MRRKEKEITEPEHIEAILQEAQVCRIGMADDDMPYIVPVCFGYEAGCLYFHSAVEGKKIDILRKNPRVCFEVDIPGILTGSDPVCARGMHYRSVIGFGIAEFVTAPEEKRKGLSCIVSHYTTDCPAFPDEAVHEVTVIKVRIDEMTGKQS